MFWNGIKEVQIDWWWLYEYHCKLGEQHGACGKTERIWLYLSLDEQLAKFTVGVHSSDFDKLVSYGAIEEVLEGIYVLDRQVQVWQKYGS